MTRRRQLLAILGPVLLIAALGLGWYLIRPPEAAAPPEAGDAGVITAYDRTQGDAKAPVTLIEYAAPRCPHCAQFNALVMPQLKARYIDTGKLRYVLRIFPLAAGDGVAEKLARCQPQDQYFSFMDRLFRNQPRWDDMYGVADVRGALVQIAQEAGMSADQANRCIDDSSTDAAINRIADEGQTKYNITGTPTIIVNGAVQPPAYDDIARAIDAELAKKP